MSSSDSGPIYKVCRCHHLRKCPRDRPTTHLKVSKCHSCSVPNRCPCPSPGPGPRGPTGPPGLPGPTGPTGSGGNLLNERVAGVLPKEDDELIINHVYSSAFGSTPTLIAQIHGDEMYYSRTVDSQVQILNETATGFTIKVTNVDAFNSGYIAHTEGGQFLLQFIGTQDGRMVSSISIPSDVGTTTRSYYSSNNTPEVPQTHQKLTYSSDAYNSTIYTGSGLFELPTAGTYGFATFTNATLTPSNQQVATYVFNTLDGTYSQHLALNPAAFGDNTQFSAYCTCLGGANHDRPYFFYSTRTGTNTVVRKNTAYVTTSDPTGLSGWFGGNINTSSAGQGGIPNCTSTYFGGQSLILVVWSNEWFGEAVNMSYYTNTVGGIGSKYVIQAGGLAGGNMRIPFIHDKTTAPKAGTILGNNLLIWSTINPNSSVPVAYALPVTNVYGVMDEWTTGTKAGTMYTVYQETGTLDMYYGEIDKTTWTFIPSSLQLLYTSPAAVVTIKNRIVNDALWVMSENATDCRVWISDITDGIVDDANYTLNILATV